MVVQVRPLLVCPLDAPPRGRDSLIPPHTNFLVCGGSIERRQGRVKLNGQGTGTTLVSFCPPDQMRMAANHLPTLVRGGFSESFASRRVARGATMSAVVVITTGTSHPASCVWPAREPTTESPPARQASHSSARGVRSPWPAADCEIKRAYGVTSCRCLSKLLF